MDAPHDVSVVSDSAVLAAMAHPLRRRLMDVLKVYGPATASMLATQTGQAVGNISHHLGVLSSSGLIEQAPELAKDRRERWWRLVSAAVRWSTVDFAEDAAAAVVAEAAQSLNLDHHVQHVRAWFTTDEATKAPWEDSAFSTDKWLRLTPAELAALSAELIAVLDRWSDRQVTEDGQAREPVFVFAHGVPARP